MNFGNWRRGNDTTNFGALGDAHFATAQETSAAGLLGKKGIRLGYYRDPQAKVKDWGKVIRYNGDAHLITVAPTGSGKGRDVLVGALLEYEGSCIVIDPKGQLAAITRAQRERMGQKIIVLNPLPKELPMDLGPSAKYNPMAHLDPNSDAFGPSCETITDSIVMHDEGPNSHFSDSARQLIAGIIMHLAAHGRDGERTLVMMQKIVSGAVEGLEGFIAEALKLDREGFISGRLARFKTVSGEDRELRSIISTAITQCGFINNKAIGGSLSASEFSFRDLKHQATTVYIVLPAKFIQPCGKWFRLVLASAIAELWSEEKGKYPVLAIIDEFKQLGRLAVIADAMGMARGFGLQLWPILQNLTQLKQNYGDEWETFLGAAAVRQFFAPRENFTAEYVSKLCGVKTVVAQGQSVQHAQQLLEPDATGTSWGQHAQPLLHPHNVMALGPQESLVLGPQSIVIDAFRQPYFATPDLAALASPDPYHKHDAASPSDKCHPSGAPPENFAEREWAAAQATKEGMAPKRPLFFRVLTWGSSDNPTLNVLRKVEFVLTLPLRIPLALLAAPFALHNKPPAGVLVAVAVAGLSIFGESAWEIHSTKETLHEAARNAGSMDAVLHRSYVKDDDYYVGMREAELDAETRAGFLQFVRQNGLGALEDMTGFKDFSGVRRLSARIGHYQQTVEPQPYNSANVWIATLSDSIGHLGHYNNDPVHDKNLTESNYEQNYDLPTRTPYAKKLYMNAKYGCPSDLLPCTSMDSKVIDSYDARHPWWEIFEPWKWLIFQGRDAGTSPLPNLIDDGTDEPAGERIIIPPVAEPKTPSPP